MASVALTGRNEQLNVEEQQPPDSGNYSIFIMKFCHKYKFLIMILLFVFTVIFEGFNLRNLHRQFEMVPTIPIAPSLQDNDSYLL